MRNANVIAVAALAGALALAGCGGSSGPAKSQFVTKADAICQATQRQATPLIHQITAGGAALVTGGARASRQIAPAVQRLHTVAASGLARLKALAQPSGAKTAIQKFLTPLAKVVDAIDKAAAALSQGQGPQALGLLQQAQPLVQQVTGAATAYGLPQCESILSALG